MTTTKPFIRQSIEAEPVEAVWFGVDYIRFQFHPGFLICSRSVTISVDGEVIGVNSLFFADTACSLMNQKVKSVAFIENERIELNFPKSVLTVPLVDPNGTALLACFASWEDYERSASDRWKYFTEKRYP